MIRIRAFLKFIKFYRSLGYSRRDSVRLAWGWLAMRESQIEKHLVERVKALGGEVRKVKWVGRHGAPDRLVMLPAFRIPPRHADAPVTATEIREAMKATLAGPQPTTIWVELKATGKKPEPHQAREHERMRRMGQRVVVIDSIEGVEELLT